MGYSNRMIVLAVDPGPSNSGFAILEVMSGPGVRVTFKDGGHVPSSHEGFTAWLTRARFFAAQDAVFIPCSVAVAIETPAGFAFGPGRVPMLLATGLVAGGMDWVARHLGHRTVVATAQQVRKALCGKANADDAVVKATVRGQVFGAPERCNDHVNDALAMGVFGAWVMVGQVVVPEVPVGKAKRKRAQSKREGVASGASPDARELPPNRPARNRRKATGPLPGIDL